MPPRLLSPLLAGVLLATVDLPADEGLWVFDAPPRELVRERFGFDVSEAWLKRLQFSTIRFGGEWGSASFVSADGLAITNHHVAIETVVRLSTPERNLARDGFVAKSPADELPCPGLIFSVLDSTEDVTERLAAAAGNASGTSKDELEKAATAAEARRREIGAIERESQEKFGLRSEVVALHAGGQFMLHRYRQYTDVRLVFVPEGTLLEFGDPKRTEDPRLKFDVALFRAYENGKPAKRTHYLRWAKVAVEPGELAFVAGYPGRSQRFLPISELTSWRDVLFPAHIARLRREEGVLRVWLNELPKGTEAAARRERAEDILGGLVGLRQNRERRLGMLKDAEIWAAKLKAEEELRRRLTERSTDRRPGGVAAAAALRGYASLATAQKALEALVPRYRLLEEGDGFCGETFVLARLLVRAAAERAKPAAERLAEYTEAGRGALEKKLLGGSGEFDAGLETERLGEALQALREGLGKDDPLVQSVLAGKSPTERAAEVIGGTKVGESAFRRRILEGGVAAVDEARDPLLELARLVDPAARAVRREWEALEEVKVQAQALIHRGRTAVDGNRQYPDATANLRLSFGVGKRYEDYGRKITTKADLGGFFALNEAMKNKPPFALPESWLRARDKLRLETPAGIISGHDTLAGSSGSPLVNRAGEFAGVLFGMMRWGAVGDLAHDERIRGDISVPGGLVLEVLEKIYGAEALATEVRAGRR